MSGREPFRQEACGRKGVHYHVGDDVLPRLELTIGVRAAGRAARRTNGWGPHFMSPSTTSTAIRMITTHSSTSIRRPDARSAIFW